MRSHSRYLFTCAKKLAIAVGASDAIAVILVL
jgi:hypothetical protein